ncbi:hypothetical protein SAMN05444166_4979 [Singulisphaera sp. GP187]|uniref:hypothetical protein n=1 Tax=Singulisphaera sp. GP187 TaxID=1882752 RepID=UPI0009292678|nr:hypothetical protein [Singulisphaera sp. GP187]SIO46677.1 hypothetical protein SAMN05444166_4979 [Singulisphaera sp. GP187]
MMLLTFIKFALTPFDAPSADTDNLMDESPNDVREEDLTWFSLNLDRRTLGRPGDELARLSLTTPEPGSAANSDFGRWM